MCYVYQKVSIPSRVVSLKLTYSLRVGKQLFDPGRPELANGPRALKLIEERVWGCHAETESITVECWRQFSDEIHGLVCEKARAVLMRHLRVHRSL